MNKACIRTLIEVNDNAIIIIDPTGYIIDANQCVLNLLGLERRDLKGKAVKDYFTEPNLITELIDLVLEKGQVNNKVLYLRTKPGAPIQVPVEDSLLFSASLMKTSAANIKYIILVGRKGTVEKLINEIDMTTGLGNRNTLIHQLKLTIEAPKSANTLSAILSIDLDNFKKINFSYDYHIGDEILREMAARLRAILAPNNFLARIADDEFVIILKNVKNKTEVYQYAQAILAIIRQGVAIEGTFLYLTASIGISFFSHDGDNTQSLLKNAEITMFEAKTAGGNCYRSFENNKKSLFKEKTELENALHTALEKNGFILYYQPIMSFRSRKIIGVEALLRWRTEDGQLRLPNEFLPTAEDCNLMSPIAYWVIDTALRQTKILQTLHHPAIVMSINFSPSQLKLDLLRYLQAKLDEYALSPQTIRIELTENSILENNKETELFLKTLHDMKVQLSIDDFGMEYSSLRYLKTYSVDNLKIDRLFIEGLPKSPYSVAIVTAILAMAKALKISVTAEGVETAHQLHFLQKNGCDEAQGFYLSQPLSEKELTQNFTQLIRKPPYA